MSTRSIIAAGDKDSWEGVYHHFDGYPTWLGSRIMWKLASEPREAVEAYIRKIIVGHPAGWSSVEHYGTGDDGNPVKVAGVCYCHDRGEADVEMIFTSRDEDLGGTEWVYVIDPEAMHVYVGKVIWAERDEDFDKLTNDTVVWVGDIEIAPKHGYSLAGMNALLKQIEQRGYDESHRAYEAQEKSYEMPAHIWEQFGLDDPQDDIEDAYKAHAALVKAKGNFDVAIQRMREAGNEQAAVCLEEIKIDLEIEAKRTEEPPAEPIEKPVALFRLGQVVATPGALAALEKAGETTTKYLRRHITGDWGEVDEHDRQENDLSVKEGYRILSAYTLSTGVKFWIITEADRSATTFLLPDEY